jgi:hypothetical protein
MPTEFKIEVEGELSDGTAEAVAIAIQKAVLLELAGSRDLAAELERGEGDVPALSYRPNIRGGKYIIGKVTGPVA